MKLEYYYVIAALLILIPVIWKYAAAYDLKSAFKKLGDMSGRTKDDVIKKAGKPAAITYLDGGLQQLQWSAGKYHVILLFDKDNRFIKIVSEVNP